MSSEQPVQVWFISGTSRGIGLQLARIVAEHGYIVFAGARNPANATALQNLAARHSNIHIVKHEASSAADAVAIAQEIEKVAGGLDVIVPNAVHAPLEDYTTVKDTNPESLIKHMQVNTVGPMLLFQTLYPLLLKRPTRKFVPLTSIVGSITLDLPLPFSLTSYAASKATMNFITKQIAKENAPEGLIAFVLNPGTVHHEDGSSGAVAKMLGMERLPDSMTSEEGGEVVFKMIDAATKERSGRFMSYDGTELPW
jgi:NAD(P)-dependent dehydrogenase (short-subunit alcohol dehydrogenase family)